MNSFRHSFHLVTIWLIVLNSVFGHAQESSGETKAEARQLYERGMDYLEGRGVPRDLAKANDFFQRSGEMGYGRGFSKLASNVYNGHGVTKNIPEAIALSEKACELGDGWGYFNLGSFHARGAGFPESQAEANRLYRKAGELGCDGGWHNLGNSYLLGRGVDKDPEAANECFEKAVRLGAGDAMNNLGMSYLHGRGVVRDVSKAVELFEQAGKKGFGVGYRNLGGIYAEGKAVPKDEALAIDYYRKGAALGDHACAEFLVEKGIHFEAKPSNDTAEPSVAEFSARLGEAAIHVDLERYDEAIRLCEKVIGDLDRVDPAQAGIWLRAHSILGLAYLGSLPDDGTAPMEEIDRGLERAKEVVRNGVLGGNGSERNLRDAQPNAYGQLMELSGRIDLWWCSDRKDYNSPEGVRRWRDAIGSLYYGLYLSQDPKTASRLHLAIARAKVGRGQVELEEYTFNEGIKSAETALALARESRTDILLIARTQINLGTAIVIRQKLATNEFKTSSPEFIRGEKLVAEGARTYEQFAPETKLTRMATGILAELSSIRAERTMNFIFRVLGGGMGSAGNSDEEAERQRIIGGMQNANQRARIEGRSAPYPEVSTP